MKCLVGVDGSRFSMDACREAGRLLRNGDSIVLVFVSPIRFNHEWMGPVIGSESAFVGQDVLLPPTEEDREHARKLLGAGRLKLLEGLHEDVDPAQVGLDLLMRQGNAREALEDLSRELAIDLLVIGTRGLGAVKRVVLGSTSDYLCHHAPCAVLVVREKEPVALPQMLGKSEYLRLPDKSSADATENKH